MASAESAEGAESAAPAADEDARRGSPLSRRRMGLGGAALALALVALAGAVTRSVGGASGIVASDQSLLSMQRMGPPPSLIGLYQLLAADTVSISNPSTGRLISTGLYVGSVLKPGTLPSFFDGLPAHLQRLLELGSSNSDLVFFVAPARGIDTRSVTVGASWKQLAGTVVKLDRPADLAAIAAVVPQNDVAKFYVPLPIAPQTVAAIPLTTLLIRLNPASYSRSAGFSFTSGGISDGRAWCDRPVAGASSGSPIVYISPFGDMELLGLAVPAAVPHRCSVIASWTLGQFADAVMAASVGVR